MANVRLLMGALFFVAAGMTTGTAVDALTPQQVQADCGNTKCHGGGACVKTLNSQCYLSGPGGSTCRNEKCTDGCS